MVEKGAKALGLPYLQIRYEDLVQDPKKHLTQIFDFLGVPFEENCLKFYQNQKRVDTASYQQVKTKLYSSGLDFAKKNYPEQYKEMTKIGEETLKHFGYEV